MTHASLFSGIGGPEIAATMLGWENLFHCEINEFGRKILDYWYPNSKSYEDITKTNFSEWRGKVDVLTGGFPCQPFSYAGKRRGADDDRYLWPFMFKAIDQIRPTWIVAENVAGITTMVEQGEVSEMGGQASIFEEVDGLHRYRLAETFTLQRICDDLESHGYAVQPVLVPACAVGAPHRRDRVFIVAKRSSSNTADNGCGCYERQAREERKNSKNEERHKESKPKRLGLRCEPRTAGIGTTPSDTSCSGAGTPEESGRTERERSRVDGKPEERGEPSEWSYGFYELLQYPSYTECLRLERWDAFPTVSPVHRGNDGIPFPLDDLTISPSKWRTESLKAYGNAIVPQVMYEIFRAIEETYDTRH